MCIGTTLAAATGTALGATVADFAITGPVGAALSCMPIQPTTATVAPAAAAAKAMRPALAEARRGGGASTVGSCAIASMMRRVEAPRGAASPRSASPIRW